MQSGIKKPCSMVKREDQMEEVMEALFQAELGK